MIHDRYDLRLELCKFHFIEKTELMCDVLHEMWIMKLAFKL